MEVLGWHESSSRLETMDQLENCGYLVQLAVATNVRQRSTGPKDEQCDLCAYFTLLMRIFVY